jgi:outer membrane protein assembly factor BamB
MSRGAAWAVLAGCVALAAAAQDWPQWRGPQRDGLTTLAPRASWPATLKKDWRVEVGEGHSSPVVQDGNVYQFARKGGQEVVTALDLQTGRTLWAQAYEAPYQMNSAATSHGPGPKSTPVLAEGRLYTFGISGILSCFEAATGRLLWRKHFGAFHARTSPLYGAAMSPAADQGLLFVHVGGHDDGALTAFDAATGVVRWSFKGDGPGYASPVVADLDGVRQVITQTQTRLLGVSAAKGEPLWQVPFTTEYDQNAVTPLLLPGGLVVFSGLDRPVVALRPRKAGAGWTMETAWQNADVPLYMSSPVLAGDRIYGFTHRRKGQLFALDARTGQTLWLSEGRQGENGALVAGGGHLFLLTSEAQLVVLKADAPSYAPLRTYTVAESASWAHPVVQDGRILVKDADSLTAWLVE